MQQLFGSFEMDGPSNSYNQSQMYNETSIQILAQVDQNLSY
jgi:hypothetical protein